LEHINVQEAFVLKSSSSTISSVLRPDRYRDLLWHFEAEDEVLWNGVKQLGPILRGRKLVKRQIAADRWIHFSVFGRALLLELRVRELPTRMVATLAVDASEPTVVLPRAGAEVDLTIGERP